MTQVELWVCIDAVGDYGIGKDEDAAKEQYEQDIGDLSDASGFRCYQLNLSVPLPVPVVLSATVPADADGPVALTVS